MSHARDLPEDALAAAHQRLQNSHIKSQLRYDDRFQGDHLGLHAHHPHAEHSAWVVQVLNPGVFLTFYAESAAAAQGVAAALAHFEADARLLQLMRRRIRRRMSKLSRDLARHWSVGSACPGVPNEALAQLRRLFPNAPLMVGLSGRVRTRLKDTEAYKLKTPDNKRRVLRLRFAALVPTAGPGQGLRVAPYLPSRGVFSLIGMTPAALTKAEALAGVSAKEARAALPSYVPASVVGGSGTGGDWSEVDSLGFWAEAGCNGADIGFTACDVLGSCDGLDGCDIGGCDI